MRSTIFILALIFSALSFADNDDCKSTTPLERDFGDAIEQATKECSPDKVFDQPEGAPNPPLADYFNVPKKDMCECIKNAKFIESKVPDKRIKNFKNWEYDQAIREKLAHSFQDMVANFSKFNSLILTKDHLGNLIDNDEIKKTGGYCNINTLYSFS